MFKKLILLIVLLVAGCETPRLSIKTVAAKFEVFNLEKSEILYKVYSEDDYGTFVDKEYYKRIKVGQKVAAVWRHRER